MKGKVLEVEKDGLIAKVKIAIEPTIITAVITKMLRILSVLRKTIQ